VVANARALEWRPTADDLAELGRIPHVADSYTTFATKPPARTGGSP
jgi:hypothetical protein